MLRAVLLTVVPAAVELHQLAFASDAQAALAMSRGEAFPGRAAALSFAKISSASKMAGYREEHVRLKATSGLTWRRWRMSSYRQVSRVGARDAADWLVSHRNVIRPRLGVIAFARIDLKAFLTGGNLYLAELAVPILVFRVVAQAVLVVQFV